MTKPETWRAIQDGLVVAWAVVGPLIGVFVGAYIANRNQRRQWVADNKRQEYLELLTALVEACGNLIALYTPGTLSSPEEQRRCDETEKRVGVVILDRIFIARDVKSIDLAERWSRALSEVHRTRDPEPFANTFSELLRDVTASAMKIITV